MRLLIPGTVREVTSAASEAMPSIGMTFVMNLVTQRYRTKVVLWIFAGFSMSIARAVLALRTLPRLGAPEARVGGRGGASERAERIFRDLRILLGAGVTVFGAIGMYTVCAHITLILEDEIGFSDGVVSLGLIDMGAEMLVSNLVSGHIAVRGRPRRVRYMFLVEVLLLISLPPVVTPPRGMLDLPLIGLIMYFFNASVRCTSWRSLDATTSNP